MTAPRFGLQQIVGRLARPIFHRRQSRAATTILGSNPTRGKRWVCPVHNLYPIYDFHWHSTCAKVLSCLLPRFPKGSTTMTSSPVRVERRVGQRFPYLL